MLLIPRSIELWLFNSVGCNECGITLLYARGERESSQSNLTVPCCGVINDPEGMQRKQGKFLQGSAEKIGSEILNY